MILSSRVDAMLKSVSQRGLSGSDLYFAVQGVVIAALGERADLASPDGWPLATYGGLPSTVPIVTVEVRPKWYRLFVVHPDGRVEPHDFGVLDPFFGKIEDRDSPYLDHVPNPAFVRAWAESIGGAVDEHAEELLEGRWQLEVVKS